MPSPATDTALPPTRQRAACIVAAATAVVAAVVLSWVRPGSGWPLTTLVMIGAIVVAFRGEIRSRNALMGILAAALIVLALSATPARTLSAIVPSVDGGIVLLWMWSAAAAVTATAAAAHLLVIALPQKGFLAGGIEWALTAGCLLVLFGHAGDPLPAAGPEHDIPYARNGSWQLLAFTGLSVVVIAVAAWIAPRSATADRVLLRTLVGLLLALTLVSMASAAYEPWLAVLFLLILIAGIRLPGRWLGQAAAFTAGAALLGLAILSMLPICHARPVQTVPLSPPWPFRCPQPPCSVLPPQQPVAGQPQLGPLVGQQLP